MKNFLSRPFQLIILGILLFSYHSNASLRSPSSVLDPINHSCLSHATRFLSTNQQLANQYNPIDFLRNPITIGIEVEGIVSNQIGRVGLTEKLLTTLRQHYENVHLFEDEFQYFTIQYNKGNFTYTWKVKGDASVVAQEGEMTMELVSPILRDEDDLRIFSEVVTALKNSGFQAEPKSAGIHVHIGFPQANSSELLLLTKVFADLEKQLLKKFSFSHGRSLYVRTIYDEVQDLLQHFTRYKPVSDLIGAFRSRNTTFNLYALRKHGTVEFRLFNSTLNAQEIEVMYDFAARFVAAIRSKNPAFMNYIISPPTGKIELEEIAKMLDMKLAEGGKLLDRVVSNFQTNLKLKNATVKPTPINRSETNNGLVQDIIVTTFVVATFIKFYDSLFITSKEK